MVAYEPVPLPRCSSHPSLPDIAASVHRWVVSAPMRDLVRAFGGAPPADADEAATAALLQWLDDFSYLHWDFRARRAQQGPTAAQGVERHEADEPDLDTEQVALVLAAAEALGLVRATRPRHDRYTHLIVLGGLARACLLRTSYAAALLSGGLVGRPEVAALGSLRPLNGEEDALLVQHGAAGCQTEMDAMDVGVQRYFGFVDPTDEASHIDSDNPRLSWRLRTYHRDAGPTVRVLAAPADEGVKRANTADTQRFWAEGVQLTPQDRVLVVTSAIYVPFQHADAIRTLGVPFGVDVDTVGVEAGWSPDASLHQPVTPGRYLQEIRSGIRSMRWLLDAVQRATAPTTAPA